MEQKQKKAWKKVLQNRADKTEWAFPTMAIGNYSGIVVMMHGIDPETGEGHGTVLITEGDRKEGDIKKTWQMRNFTPIDGNIGLIEVEPKKAKNND